MPPKKQFSKEQIINTAFEIARIEGIDNITIRKVAGQMGSSIAPIYVNFKDIDELKQAVITKIFDICQQMAIEKNTGNPFCDIGIASLRFAREYSVFFRDLVMKSNGYMNNYDQELGTVLIEEMKKDPTLTDFSEEELRTILLKMRIFQLGLSVMVANGLLPETLDEESMISILENTATDVIAAAHIRRRESIE